MCLPRQREKDFVDVDEAVSRDVPELKGQVYPEQLVEGSFEKEISAGMDVAVYTRIKRSRPWLGRVVSIDSKCQKFKLQWFARRSRGSTFYGMSNSDSSPFVSEQDVCSVMLWDFSISFSVSSYWLDKIAATYEEHDKCYE